MLAPPSVIRQLHRRFRPTWLMLMLLCGSTLAEETSQTPEQQGNCQALYQPGDPALYEFVSTRAATDFSPWLGYRINAINYIVLPIFNPNDPDENNRLYRLANWLHIDTRHKALRKQMIIEPGETLTQETLTENERLLRANSYLVDAMILPQKVCADSIDLLVVVRDIWTFSPTVTASRSGGEDSTGAGITESNLFGTGQRISLGYFQDSDRSGTVVSYTIPQVFERVNLDTTVYDNSDGDVIKFSLTRPFYELDSSWAAGFSGTSDNSIQTIRINEVVVNSYRRDTNDLTLFGGWSPGRRNGSVNRFLLGYTEEKDTFSVTPDTTALPADEVLRYPWLAWSYQQDRFLTAENINRTHRQEDIQLGYSHYVQLGYASTDLGNDQNTVTFDIGAAYTTYIEPYHLLTASTYALGQRSNNVLRNTFFGTRLDYVYIINDKNRWYLRSYFDGGRNIRPDQQLTSGGLANLRGYPNDYQRGNRRWVFSAERRRFTNWHIFNLLYFGYAGYFDAGRTWDTETPGAPKTDALADVGFGLRFSPSKFRIDKVIHVDIAAPLVNVDEVDDYQLIVTGSVDF